MLITASEIIKNSWETYSKNWKKLFPYVVLMFITSAALTIIGFAGLKIEALVINKNVVLLNNLVVAALDVAILLFTLWTTVALFKNLRQVVENKEMISIKESYFQTSKYLWPIIWTSILVFLAVLAGFFLLLIPALIFAIWFTYVFYIVIFEDKKGVSALKESKTLVTGRWWKTLWLLLAPAVFFGLIIVVIQMVISSPFGIFLDQESLAYILTNSLLSTIVSAIFAPLTALTTLYLYLSAKANPIEKPTVPPAEVK